VQFARHRFGLLRPVVMGDAEQHEQPGSVQLADHLASDEHRCFGHSAYYRPHGAGYCQVLRLALRPLRRDARE